MSFDALHPHAQNIAIIGSGISGLSAAWQLAPHNRVTIYEAASRLGGHSRTITAGRRGDQPVDTGFIVFNYANYPHLTRMFADLDVPVERSDMSFGVSIDQGRIEYALRDLRGLIAQKRNLGRPGFYRMIADIAKFNARAVEMAVSDEMTIDDLMGALKMGDWFRRFYLLPICGAIWSTPAHEIGAFPARSLLRFFENHALLSATGQHQWWTVSGGSIEYVRRLEAALRLRGVEFRMSTSVTSVQRSPKNVTIQAENSLPDQFDQVIVACHSDQALRILDKPSGTERKALSAIRYQPNDVYLHRDEGQMPRRRDCWSSWIYQAAQDQQETRLGVTYWMNKLQNIPQDDPLFVTLNPNQEIPEASIYDHEVFWHPVFDRAAVAAQSDIAAIQGQNRTWFAGAWLRHGFHEDGFASAARVARALNRGFAPAGLIDKVPA
ncbi:cyclopropane-fatty-acyl-phospholipid synthase [Thioclava dalianensis]|uniref:Cyclopropane-fatty-acyl-phospholipid synthase n=1 Tax=Thioclava dalianensis TaxID=1185766 RepID=A0A074TIR6_9RHOB|nr:FAD-dependent oxidoreductase [Thioclava dalianensis]KEP68903.1 cyclopropane-fatty-acyl-phospholipid synthase [Thioclava dalianensis]SFN35715.1 Predicted NAD/FAD-binding protein [Thioclava dalianensis]